VARARSAKSTYSVEVEGLGSALLVPDQLERARVTFPRRLAVELSADLRRRLPRGPGPGHVADDVVGEVVTGANVVTVGTEGSTYAKALEEGAHRPGASGLARGVVLRWVHDGRVVFARRSILPRTRPGGKPFTRALRGRTAVVERVWAEVMRA
jgi:hypothetical protein